MKYLLLILVALAACGDDGTAKSVDELMDPNTCTECHARYHDQWSASMHAYSTTDPVFVAMHKRGQRETHGELGLFCVQCHAPMAVATGVLTKENVATFDLSTLDAKTNGVTCYFCHNVKAVNGDHNNPLELAMDQTMRGGAKSPVSSPAHHSKYDPLMDGNINNSEMCGSCHDLVTPKGVALERTFAEWKTTFFKEPDPQHHLSCNGCHMKSSSDTIADKSGLSVPFRMFGVHEHLWPAIDEALTPWPGMDVMAAGIHRDLKGAIAITGGTPRTGPPAPGGICVEQPGTIRVRIDSLAVAHKWPSGAAQDRRAWLELTAYRADMTIAFQTGHVLDGQDPEEVPGTVTLFDKTFKDDGTTPAHFFWDVASHDDSSLIKPPVTLDFNDPAFDHSFPVKFENIPNIGEIEHIDARVRIRPLPFAMLNDLVASGDLDPSIPGKIHTLDIDGTVRHWDKSTAGMGAATNTGCSPFSTY